MNKVLFTATVDSHILHFHIPYLKWFKEQGFEVHVASFGNKEIPYADKKYNIPFSRSPWSFDNIKAYKMLKEIINDNSYRLIHCHTPVGGVLTRLAAKKARTRGTRVIYTAHGFHFYKGAPLKNWLLYYPVEKWLSRHTDCLITINEEDYNLAVRKNFKAGSIEKVDGVGVDLNRFTPQTEELKRKLRREYGFGEDDFILICVGELNHNKHQDLIIDAVALLRQKIPTIKLLLAGDGNKKEEYENKVKKMGLGDCVFFLGHRNNIPDLFRAADVAVSASRREGLPVNIMEAMATGLPLIVTDCRGNRDLVNEGENGFVISLDDAGNMADRIEEVYKNTKLRDRFCKENLRRVKKYSLEVVKSSMIYIYTKVNIVR